MLGTKFILTYKHIYTEIYIYIEMIRQASKS